MVTREAGPHDEPRDDPRSFEVPVYIPSRGERVGGVVSMPEDAASPVGVVMVAGRARDRVHRNGMFVRMSRELARSGLYALRLDYPGVGISTGPPQIFSLERPPIWAIQDACRFLVENTPVRRVLLVGTCFGGRLQLQAAPTIAEAVGLAVVSSPVLARTPSFGRRALGRLTRALPRPRPSSDGGPNAMRQRREHGLALQRRVSPAFARAANRFAERGHMYFLYGAGDFLADEIRFALERLNLPSGSYEIEFTPGEMHVFASTAAQDVTVSKVADWCARTAREVGG